MNANLPSNPATIKSLLDEHGPALQEALPRHIKVSKVVRVIVTQLNKNPDLQKCTPQSLMSSILTSCLYGLEPDGREGALVPFNNKKQIGGKDMWVKEAQFIPMYRGELKLARRSGELALAYAEIVRDNDIFEMERGMDPRLKHVPALVGDGKVIGAYAVYRLKSGEADFTWMNITQITKIQNRGKKKKFSPWDTDWDEMAKKTVLKRMLKMAPSEVEKDIDHDGIQDNLSRALSTMALPNPELQAIESIEEPKEIEAPTQTTATETAPKKSRGPARKAKVTQQQQQEPPPQTEEHPQTTKAGELDLSALIPEGEEGDLPFSVPDDDGGSVDPLLKEAGLT